MQRTRPMLVSSARGYIYNEQDAASMGVGREAADVCGVIEPIGASGRLAGDLELSLLKRLSEKRVAGLIMFGVIHRGIGAAQQSVASRAIVGRHGNSDAGKNRQIEWANRQWRRQDAEYFGRD